MANEELERFLEHTRGEAGVPRYVEDESLLRWVAQEVAASRQRRAVERDRPPKGRLEKPVRLQPKVDSFVRARLPS